MVPAAAKKAPLSFTILDASIHVPIAAMYVIIIVFKPVKKTSPFLLPIYPNMKFIRSD